MDRTRSLGGVVTRNRTDLPAGIALGRRQDADSRFLTMQYSDLHRLYHQPLFDLLKQARAVHEEHWPEREVQLCTLLSIKTGGCSEGCGYCAQSARYNTGVKAEQLMETEAVLEVARRARENGSTRICM